MTAHRDGDEYVINGRKYWPCNVAGWDGKGANTSIVVVRTAPEKGGTEGLSAIMVDRGTPGVSFKLIKKVGHRLTPNAEIIFDNARVPGGEPDRGHPRKRRPADQPQLRLVGTRWPASPPWVSRARPTRRRWTGPRPTRPAARTRSSTTSTPATCSATSPRKIEACRYFCWKTAHYLDQHDYHGEMIGAMCKMHCTELLFDAVYKCMQVVGVNSVDCQHPFEKLLREAAIFPLYDAGNFGMQRRRVHGVMSADSFNPRAIMDDEPQEYTKAMEVTDTISGHELETRHLATVG